MLSFEQKLNILDSFPELEKKTVSLGRVNYHFEGSVQEKKTVGYHLHPNGNGFIYAGLLKGYDKDAKGYVNIREFSESQLRGLVHESILSLTANDEVPVEPLPSAPSSIIKPSPGGGNWVNEDGHVLTLKYEDDIWYIYSGIQLEMAFETREEAGIYLEEEGFQPFKGTPTL